MIIICQINKIPKIMKKRNTIVNVELSFPSSVEELDEHNHKAH